jgi:ring-1,2-phenylacetyl-CoA epoxidase subunit PaaD
MLRPVVADAELARAWQVLAGVPDPEVPAVSLCDLGIVREVLRQGDTLEVVLTPTYSGCPATEVIAQSVVQALQDAGLGPVAVRHQWSPAWTTDWISATGRQKLLDYGIAPPLPGAAACGLGGYASGMGNAVSTIRILPRAVPCPRCGSQHTERLSAFGSTACKALHRCLDCREPFEYFKPI